MRSPGPILKVRGGRDAAWVDLGGHAVDVSGWPAVRTRVWGAVDNFGVLELQWWTGQPAAIAPQNPVGALSFQGGENLAGRRAHPVTGPTFAGDGNPYTYGDNAPFGGSYSGTNTAPESTAPAPILDVIDPVLGDWLTVAGILNAAGDWLLEVTPWPHAVDATQWPAPPQLLYYDTAALGAGAVRTGPPIVSLWRGAVQVRVSGPAGTPFAITLDDLTGAAVHDAATWSIPAGVTWDTRRLWLPDGVLHSVYSPPTAGTCTIAIYPEA